MAGYAAPVVELADEDANTYRLNLEELQKILGNEKYVDKRVALISIAGAFRMGKSFILNFFVTFLDWLESGEGGKWFNENTTLDKFHWSGGTKRDTNGIYLWSKPYLLKDVNDEDVVVLLMDTQGTFDHQSTVQDCATIFAMSTLLSSVQIFNVRNHIQEDDLNNLLLFTEYAHLAVTEGEDAMAPFQRLLFLIRDWQFSDENCYGYEGGESYLNSVLEVTPTQKPELQNLRRNLRSSFDNIMAFLLPHPGLRIANNHSELSLGQVEPDFTDQLEVFVPSLFGGEGDYPLEAKTINGREITCGELMELFKAYMGVFNSADLPSPKTILEATADGVNAAAEKKAMNKYNTFMSKKMALHKALADMNTLNKLHTQAKREALEVFAARPKLGRPEAAKAVEDNLVIYFQNRFNEYKETVEKNIAIIEEKKRLEEERKRVEAEQEKERLRIEAEKEKLRKEMDEAEKMRDRELEEKNRRLRTVYEDEGVAYSAADVDTVGAKLKEALRLRKKQLENIFKSIRQSRTVQLCFLVDATGSMGSHIAGVKKSIEDIVKQLTDTGPHVHFQGSSPNAQEMFLSFVAYRDHCDKLNPELLGFTKSTADFKKFCGALVADGGGDAPEDVLGGLNAALKLKWDPQIGTKVIFHIGDAPPHGTEFKNPGDEYEDSYPKGDPHGLNHVDLFRNLRTMGIQYYFGKINPHTDTMVRKFSEAYEQPIVDFDVRKVENIRDTVVTAVRQSICATLATSKDRFGRPKKEKPYTIVKSEPVWIKQKECRGTCTSYEWPESMKDILDDVPLERKDPVPAVVKIAPNPFDKGAERFAFYGREQTNGKNENVVLKEYLAEEHGTPSPDRYELFDQMQNTAAFMAQSFLEKLREKSSISLTIEFLPVRTLSFIDDGGNQRHMTVEKRFASTEKFVRFSNNADYILTEEEAEKIGISAVIVQLVMAFSHWTYRATGRFLMVVDLEGMVTSSGVLLTDPGIHCLDVLRYGHLNHGAEGMKNFFSRHTCNRFCNDLGLDCYVPS